MRRYKKRHADGTKEDEPIENGKSNERVNDIWLGHSMKSSARGESELS